MRRAAGPVEAYYPGAQYADVVTMDIYGEFKQEYYDSMLALAGTKPGSIKPIAIAELGTVPPLEVWARQPRWAYFMMWSGSAEGSNTPEHLQEVFHAPTMLSRDDAAMAKVRTSAHIPASAVVVEPVARGYDAAAGSLLQRLHSVGEGRAMLSGQGNTASAPDAATGLVVAATGKQPGVYAVELDESSVGSAEALKTMRAGVVAAVLKQAGEGSAKAVVSLTWRPMSPGLSSPGAAPSSQSRMAQPAGQLTDFEWKELLTEGSGLHRAWAAQVDEMGKMLKQLESAGIAVLWSPYPDANSKKSWWSRAGGSGALYRMLFDRLTETDGVHNLVWVWEVVPGGYGPGASGALADYAPGLLHMDAMVLDAEQVGGRWGRGAEMLRMFSGGKPAGVRVTGKVPAPQAFEQQGGWSWFVLSPETVNEEGAGEALKSLYGMPQIGSLPPVEASRGR